MPLLLLLIVILPGWCSGHGWSSSSNCQSKVSSGCLRCSYNTASNRGLKQADHTPGPDSAVASAVTAVASGNTAPLMSAATQNGLPAQVVISRTQKPETSKENGQEGSELVSSSVGGVMDTGPIGFNSTASDTATASSWRYKHHRRYKHHNQQKLSCDACDRSTHYELALGADGIWHCGK